jgi:hypothetical protein
MRLNEKSIGNNGSKSAQGGNESELPDFLSEIEIKRHASEMLFSMNRRQVALNWQLEHSECDQSYHHEKGAYHNSFP